MKNIHSLARKYSWFLLMVTAAVSTRADTNAVVPLNSYFNGYVNGAVGYSFTPTANLAVTQVGYWDVGLAQPVVSFWSGTNYVFANFRLAAGSGSGALVFSNVNFQLLAGQRYTITLQDLATATLLNVYTNLQVAPQLTNYSAQIFLQASNAFTPYGSNYLFAGPNFSYTNLTAAPTLSSLQIARSAPTNVTVSWPASPAGFILQQNPILNSTNWTFVTNTIVVSNGTNQILLQQFGINFFRLIHP